MTDESSRTDNEKWDYKSKNSIAADEETASGSFDSEAENTKFAATGGFDYFFAFRLQKCQKKCIFAVRKK